MGQVFISYAHEDTSNIGTIMSSVEAAGHKPWVDQHMKGGTEFPVHLTEQIQRSACVIVVVSESSLKSKWVGREVDHAMLHDKPIIPLVKALNANELQKVSWAEQLRKRRHIIKYNALVGKNTQEEIIEAVKWCIPKYRNGKVVSFVNFKGGVGKTTLCAMTGFFSAVKGGKRVLLIDLDPQENLTDFFLPPEEVEQASTEARTALSLFEPIRLEQAVGPEKDFDLFNKPVRGSVLDAKLQSMPFRILKAKPLAIIPSDYRLMKFARGTEFEQSTYRANFLHTLGELKKHYDIIYLDCGPSASLLSHCSLSLADFVIAPIEPNDSARRGLTSMSRGAAFVFETDIDDKVYPVFNRVRDRIGDQRIIQAYMEDPAKVSADIAFVKGQILKTQVPRSDRLLKLNSILDKRILTNDGREVEDRLASVGEALVELAKEVVALTRKRTEHA